MRRGGGGERRGEEVKGGEVWAEGRGERGDGGENSVQHGRSSIDFIDALNR